MADSTMKKYLDLAGLKAYDEKIKEVISGAEAQALQDAMDYTDAVVGIADEKLNGVKQTVAEALVAVHNETVANANAIGVASKDAVGTEGEEGYEAAVAATGLTKRIEDLEAAIGEDGSVASQIEEAINGLDITNNTSDAVAGITVKVDETDGKVQTPVVTVAANAVTYTAADADNAAKLEVASTDNVLKGDAIASIKSYTDAKAAEATAANTAAIEALDVTSNDSDKVAGIQIGVTETDGKVQKPTLTVDDNAVTYTAKTTDEAAKLEVASTTDVIKGQAIAQIKAYVDAMDEAAAKDADDRLDALEALHATYGEGVEGHTKGEMKTVATEVNEAVTALVDGAPAALDTLKEIADWIANQDESGVTDVASLVSRVDTLAGDANTAGSVAKAEADAKKYTDDEIDKLDATVTKSDKGVQVKIVETDGVIDGTEATGSAVSVTAATVTYTAAADAVPESAEGAGDGKDATDANLAVTANEGNVLDSSAIAAIKSYVDAKTIASDSSAEAAIKALDATVKQDETKGEDETSNMVAGGLKLQAVETDGKLTSIEGSINTITEADIDALFTPAGGNI